METWGSWASRPNFHSGQHRIGSYFFRTRFCQMRRRRQMQMQMQMTMMNFTYRGRRLLQWLGMWKNQWIRPKAVGGWGTDSDTGDFPLINLLLLIVLVLVFL